MSFTRFLPPVWRKKISTSHDMYSMHDAIIGAIDYTLSQVKDDTIMSKQESLLNEAEGPFLDYWGSWFGLNRKDGWSDDTYRAAIKSHVTHPRSTVEGIRQAIVNYFDLNMSDVYIYEPFRDIFRWNRGKWNSDYKLHSTYYDTAVIDIQLGKNVPSSIQDLLNWFRMAGVLWVVSYNGAAHDVNAPIFDFTSEDALLFINELQFLYGYNIYDSFSLTPGIYSEPSAAISEFIWNKSAWNSGDSWIGQESKITPYVELSQSSLDYIPSTLYNSDTQLFFGSTLEDTDYTALLANDTKYVPFSSSYEDGDNNKFLDSASLKYFSAPLTAEEDFGNYKMYHVTNGVTISSSKLDTLPKGDYYIGCYAKLSSTASVKIKYSKNEEPVLLSSSYNGKYAWNSIKITVDDNFQIPDEGIQFIVSGPFKDDDNYIGLFYLGSNEQYTDNDLSGNYVYSTFDLVGFYNRYIGELSGSDYGTEINSLYSNKLISYAFRQINTSTDASGYFNVQLYNWNLKLWVTIGTLEDTFYSYSMNDISPYVNANGYVYSRLDLTNASNKVLNLNWVGLNVSKRTEGYGIKLYSDNSNYGSYIDITTAGYLKLLYGYSLFNKDSIIPGDTIEDETEAQVLSWNNSAWSDGSVWLGQSNSGLPYIESSQSGTDYAPDSYLGAYKLFFGTPTSLEDMHKLGSKEESITYALGGQNLLINTSSSVTSGRTEIPGASAGIDGVYSRTDSYEQVTTPSFDTELFYRFVTPDTNNLYGLTPGGTYTISGNASHTTGELNFRAQYSTNGKGWVTQEILSDLEIPVSDGSVFTPFSYTFTIPVGATGIYFSLQNMDYTTGSLFRFKNMQLEKGSIATAWTPAPEDNSGHNMGTEAYAESTTNLLFNQGEVSVSNGSSISVPISGSTSTGTYNIGCYANLPANSSVSVSYSEGRDPVLLSSEYHGSYQWHYISVPFNSSDVIPSEGITFTVSMPNGTSGTLKYFMMDGSNTHYLTTLPNKYVYQTYDLANYYLNKYGKTAINSYADLFSSLYNGTLLGMNYSLTGNSTFEVYNFGTKSWDNINSLSGTTFSWRLANYTSYLSNNGVVYTRIVLDTNSSISLSQLSLDLINSSDGYGINLSSDNTDYGADLITELAKILNDQYGINDYTRVEVSQGSTSLGSSFSWNSSSTWNGTNSYTGSYPYGYQYYYLTKYNGDYSPEDADSVPNVGTPIDVRLLGLTPIKVTHDSSESTTSQYVYGTINIVQSYLDQGNQLKTSNYRKELQSNIESSTLVVNDDASGNIIQGYNRDTNSWEKLSVLSSNEQSITISDLVSYLNDDGVMYYRIILDKDETISNMYVVINTVGDSLGTNLYSSNYNYGADIITE